MWLKKEYRLDLEKKMYFLSYITEKPYPKDRFKNLFTEV